MAKFLPFNRRLAITHWNIRLLGETEKGLYNYTAKTRPRQCGGRVFLLLTINIGDISIVTGWTPRKAIKETLSLSEISKICVPNE